MSGKSQSSPQKIDRPFKPELLSRARKIASAYQILLKFEDGEYFGRGLEMPYVMGDGKTADACVNSMREALAVAVATILEAGGSPPSASEKTRSEQINFRVTPEEKLLLEEAARSRGFRGIGDYVRSTSLRRPIGS